jgi:hypothetical protein
MSLFEREEGGGPMRPVRIKQDHHMAGLAISRNRARRSPVLGECDIWAATQSDAIFRKAAAH